MFAALTELCGDDGNVVPGVLFSIQLPEDEHWPVTCMDVEHSVHVCPPINRVPAQNTHRPSKLVQSGWCGSVLCSPGEGHRVESPLQSCSGVNQCGNGHIYRRVLVKWTVCAVGGFKAGRSDSKQVWIKQVGFVCTLPLFPFFVSHAGEEHAKINFSINPRSGLPSEERPTLLRGRKKKQKMFFTCTNEPNSTS